MSPTVTRTPTELDLSVVDRFVAEIGRSQEDLIPLLTALQKHFRYLPPEAMERLCELTEIRPSDLAGVATFYKRFRHTPAGRHTVRVCTGTACHVSGADRLHEACLSELNIPGGEDTSADGDFTVEEVACLGCCMLAPVVRVDGITYGQVSPEKLPSVLKDFGAMSAPGIEARPRREPVFERAGQIHMCVCSSCAAAGADKVAGELARQVDELRIPVTFSEVGCNGQSFRAPLVEVRANGSVFRYACVDVLSVRHLLLTHFHAANPLQRASAKAWTLVQQWYLNASGGNVIRYPEHYRGEAHSPFAEAQVRIATEHAGELDPLDLDAYKAHGGFDALTRCWREILPTQVIELVTASGLRGRGGAGFPTGRKWAMAAGAPDGTRYVVCNGDEGDPGAFMDRMILESFPFRVIEGLAILAYAIGAQEGVFYIREEYPLASERMRAAIRCCEAAGLLGANVLGSSRSLNFRVVEGAGAFVCGEETALLAALEGKRGMPRARPPYPVEQGFRGQPTVINNVETLALVPWIVRHGPAAFRQYGTEKSSGTKTFALAGKINRGGLIEIPMGMTLRQIIEDIGGGIPHGRALKAVQIGGPSGGCVPAGLADTAVDYESLVAVGAIMGSGGLIVLDDSDCMVDIARFFLSFTQAESCGKCAPCRVGTRRMLEILTALCEGRARSEDVDTLERLARTVGEASLCGLGKTAPNPVLSTLRYFRDEFEAHVRGECPAGRCTTLIRYRITDACIGCTICAQRCPVEAIAITPYVRHVIDSDRCIRCDTCKQVCPEDAVVTEAIK